MQDNTRKVRDLVAGCLLVFGPWLAAGSAGAQVGPPPQRPTFQVETIGALLGQGDITRLLSVAVSSSGNLYAVGVSPCEGGGGCISIVGVFESTYFGNSAIIDGAISSDDLAFEVYLDTDVIVEVPEALDVEIMPPTHEIDIYPLGQTFIPIPYASIGAGVNQTTGGDLCRSQSGDVCGPGALGSGESEFDSPAGIATDTGGNIYIADSGNSRIQKFALDGSFLATWGSYGSGDDQFGWVQDVTTDAAGSVYVVDPETRPRSDPTRRSNPVRKFDSDGNFLAKWGDHPRLRRPECIASDPAGNVYVSCERRRRRVTGYDSDGNLVARWRIPRRANLIDIAADGFGNIYVVDSGDYGGRPGPGPRILTYRF